MLVELTPELEALVRERVQSGLYRDESDVVRDALRLLERRDNLGSEDAAGLREALQAGLDDIAAGRVTVVKDEAELKAFVASL